MPGVDDWNGSRLPLGDWPRITALLRVGASGASGDGEALVEGEGLKEGDQGEVGRELEESEGGDAGNAAGEDRPTGAG